MADAIEPIKITGLAEFNRALREVNTDLPKELRAALNKGADLVVEWAQPRVSSKSGKARRSIRATSTRTASKITGGGARVSYYPWLDFGGKVGRKKSVHRAFLPGGRYIYPGYHAREDEIKDITAEGLVDLLNRSGLQAERGS